MSGVMDWNDAANVLCIRLDALGDLLMTTPALAALKESHPARRITLLTSPASAAAAPLLPMVDEVCVAEVPWMKATPLRADSRSEWRLIHRLRGASYDGAVIFTVYSQSPFPAALCCYLADIPRRLAHARENPYQLLTDWVSEPEPQQFVRHEAQRQLDLVAAIGADSRDPRLRVRVPAEATARVLARLEKSGIDPHAAWIVIHAGASAPSRRYPAERFAETSRILHSQHGCQLVFTGSVAERPLVESIISAAGVPALSLAGETDLIELAALLESAPLLISNNTGPVHLAAAVGTPVVDLYALTNPQHAPWQVPHELLFHEVPCKYCYKSICPEGHQHCLSLVSPQAVASAALRLLASQRKEWSDVYARN